MTKMIRLVVRLIGVGIIAYALMADPTLAGGGATTMFSNFWGDLLNNRSAEGLIGFFLNQYTFLGLAIIAASFARAVRDWTTVAVGLAVVGMFAPTLFGTMASGAERSRAWEAAMKGDLRTLVDLQEEHFIQHRVFSRDVAALPPLRSGSAWGPKNGVRLVIESADSLAWRATTDAPDDGTTDGIEAADLTRRFPPSSLQRVLKCCVGVVTGGLQPAFISRRPGEMIPR